MKPRVSFFLLTKRFKFFSDFYELLIHSEGRLAHLTIQHCLVTRLV